MFVYRKTLARAPDVIRANVQSSSDISRPHISRQLSRSTIKIILYMYRAITRAPIRSSELSVQNRCFLSLTNQIMRFIDFFHAREKALVLIPRPIRKLMIARTSNDAFRLFPRAGMAGGTVPSNGYAAASHATTVAHNGVRKRDR